MFDYHVHSWFSADCDEPLNKIIETAIQLGMKEICITDHIDYEYNDPSIQFEFNLNEHREAFLKLNQTYGQRIEIKRGVELGLQPHVLERCEALVRSENFDFVLASVHECERKDFYVGDFFEGRTADESYRVYLSELEEMIKKYDAFSVVGHIDIPKRYSTEIAKLDPKNYLEYYERIFTHLIRRNQGIEINTSGLRQSVGRAFPDDDLLTLYYELGGRVLTLGSDSHTSDTLTYKFDDVKKRLKAIGFKSVTGFAKMVPYEIKL